MSRESSSADSSRDLSSAQHDCPLNHCQILVTVKDTARANVADVSIAAGAQTKLTVSGRAQFDDLRAGRLTVTATLAGDVKKAYAWAEGDVAKLPLADAETLARDISPDTSTIYQFKAVKLARPTVKVVRDDNSALLEGVGVKIESGANRYVLRDTGADGVASLAGDSRGLIPLTNYTIKLDFKGATKDKYKIIDPGAQTIAAGSTAEITVRATCLAMPRIKVVREDNGRPIADVPVDLTLNTDKYAYDLSNDQGFARPTNPDKRLMPGTYTVSAPVTGTEAKLYRYAGPTVAIAAGFEGELQIRMRPKGSLIVEVGRYDGQPLHGRVTFNLTGGPSAQNGLATLAPFRSVPPNIDSVKIDNLDFGDYVVELQNLQAIEEQGGARNWKIGPDGRGTLAVKIEGPETERQLTTGEKTARASFVLSKYTHAQPIAFNIKPTTREVNGVMSYIGSASAATDISKRMAVMIAAIKKAAAETTHIDGAASTLKIFMAPEFYFRGADGAYPFEDVSKVLQNTALNTEIVKETYKDWLFVLGSAIGYLKHGGAGDPEQHKLTITAVGTTASGNETKVTVVKGTTAVGPCAAILNNPGGHYEWTLKQGGVEASVVKSTRLNDTTFDLELNAIAAFANGKVDLVEPDEPENRFLLNVKTVTSATKIRVESGYDKVAVCSRISRSAKTTWQVYQRNTRLSIAAKTRISDNEYELDLDAPGGVLRAEPFYLLEPIATEIMNASFIKKGGPDPAPQSGLVRKGGLRELLVYKEYVSQLDFIVPPGGTDNLDIVIHGQERVVLPTEGSQDTRTQRDNSAASEVNKTGLGGGCVFTVDGVNFGVEVCLDHLAGRLFNHTAAARRGEPRIQVQLIPSWGMTIGNTQPGQEIACVAGGLIFNVDGNRADSAFRTNDTRWGCDTHAEISAAGAGQCTFTCPANLEKPAYRCSNNHWGFEATCSCGQAAVLQPNRLGCENGHISQATGVCGRRCTKALVQMGGGIASIAGPLAVTLSGWDYMSVTTTNYFQKQGSIRIYPSRALPPARTF